MLDAPGIVQRLLDFRQQRNDRVEKKNQAERAKHPDVDIIDELDNFFGYFHALFAQGCKQVQQQGLNLVMHTESLQH